MVMWNDFKKQVKTLKALNKLGCNHGIYEFKSVINDSKHRELCDEYGDSANMLFTFYKQVSDGFRAYGIKSSSEILITDFFEVFHSKKDLEAKALSFSYEAHKKNFLLLEGENAGKVVQYVINFDVRDSSYYLNLVEPIYAENFFEWLAQKVKRDIHCGELVLEMMHSNESYQNIQKASEGQTQWIHRIAGIAAPSITNKPITYEINNFNGSFNQKWEQLILKNWREENL